jgi:hypothetical protein
MTFHRKWFTLIIFLGMWVTACTSNPNNDFIQGAWIFVDPHLNEVVGQSFIEHVWVFGNGSFTYEACCLREIYMILKPMK